MFYRSLESALERALPLPLPDSSYNHGNNLIGYSKDQRQQEGSSCCAPPRCGESAGHTRAEAQDSMLAWTFKERWSTARSDYGHLSRQAALQHIETYRCWAGIRQSTFAESYMHAVEPVYWSEKEVIAQAEASVRPILTWSLDSIRNTSKPAHVPPAHYELWRKTRVNRKIWYDTQRHIAPRKDVKV